MQAPTRPPDDASCATDCRLVLIFHFGIGKHKVAAFVVQHPGKPGVACNAVAVPVSNHANRTELIIADAFAKNLNLYQRLGHVLRGYDEGVPLTACEDDW